MRYPHRFLGWPTRGGKLTIINCLMWAVVAIGVATRQPVLTLPTLVVCWPLAWLCLVPIVMGGFSSEVEVKITCVVIGLNSLLWGYGISWFLSIAERRAQRISRAHERRGFEVITHDVPPEDP